MSADANRSKRDFLTLVDLSREELYAVLAGGAALKRGEGGVAPLAGRSIATIFRKSSTRTRVSFEVAAFQLGAHAVVMTEAGSQIGRGEPVPDTARVLSRYVDAITIRTFEQGEVEEMARHASVPVVNALTDDFHPCQLLADLMTVQEAFGPDLSGVRVAWIGDGNNMAHSWLNAARLLGFQLALACPPGYDPNPALVEAASGDATVRLVRDPAEAAAGASIVTTDVWASMGQEEEARARLRAFEGFTVDDALMSRAREDAIFLHCLPAHRGEEVTAGVMEGPASRVFDEAENRLHAQKALLLFLMAPDALPEPAAV